MNVWSFTGNLGGDAETRFTTGGDPVVSFSVAVKAGYGKSESTSWAKCTLWGKRGEAVAPYLLKGTQVGVSGEVALREWEAKDGTKRQNLEVRVNDVTLLGGKKPAQPEAEPEARRQPAAAGTKPGFDDMDEDIPF